MSYIVFARKYRPKSFSDIVGQEHITTTLKNAVISKRIAHAYLFAGPRGVGKTTTARILAKAINCEKGANAEPCNECSICKEISSGASLDIIEMDAASNRGIDEIRELRENVRFTPTRCSYKVYIIDEVHMLTEPAFNALLKTLEEPPAHVIFILATTEANKIPLTIQSRCQKFYFKRMTVQEIIDNLNQIAKGENIKVEKEALAYIARAVDGSLRDAQSIFDQLISFTENEIKYKDVTSALGIVDIEEFIKFDTAMYNQDTRAGLKLVDELVKKGCNIPRFVKDWLQYARDLLMCKIKMEEIVDIETSLLPTIKQHADKFSIQDIMEKISILSDLDGKLKRSDQQRLLVEIAVIRLIKTASPIPEQSERYSEDKYIGSATKENGGTMTERNTGSTNKTSEKKVPVEVSETKGNGVTKNVQVRLKGILEVNTQDNAEKILSVNEIEEVPNSKDTKLDIQKIKKMWQFVLEKIGQENKRIHSLLINAQPAKYENDTIMIEVVNDFNKGSLERPENKKIVEVVFENEMHTKVRLKFVVKKTHISETERNTGSETEGNDIGSTERSSPERMTESVSPVVEETMTEENGVSTNTVKSGESKIATDNPQILKSAKNIFGGRIVR
ncbi:MAG: DNA polymerase III subunit gamma/tau [Candidatus Firestonebacteria bacterium]